MPQDHASILEALSRNADALRSLGVLRLSLFGSGARGERGDASDLDFLVEMDPITFDGYMGVKEFLEDLFDCPVDLVLREDLKPDLRENVLRDMVDVPGI